MKRIAVLPALALALVAAACDSGGVQMKNASVAEVADEMRRQGNDRFVDPGKWEQKATLI